MGVIMIAMVDDDGCGCGCECCGSTDTLHTTAEQLVATLAPLVAKGTTPALQRALDRARWVVECTGPPGPCATFRRMVAEATQVVKEHVA
jgi:hypothetical protein